MAKNNLPAVTKDTNCLNCGFQFRGDEIFCPNCGQKNKGKRITFKSFVREVFAGFFSWDAKFWKTLLPLLFKPGKVSKDYINGKRSTYSNPFRFYLTTSVLFFLLIGLNNTIKEYRVLSSTETKEESIFEQTSDSIKKQISLKDNSGLFNVGVNNLEDSIKKGIEDGAKASKNQKLDSLKDPSDFDSLIKFNIRNPDISTDKALDSLGIEKNFTNRLKYSKAKTFASIVSGTGVKSFLNNIVSKISVALFILLPIFALFFKFIYIRRKYTYVEHLIFIFHTQTVFFLIFSFYVIFEIIWHNKIEANGSTIMTVLLLFFMVYLFIAMKRFYKQGFFKTTVKYILANISFFMLSTLGISVLTVIIFILN
ncbi:DUF3667 domain-containing protein [uncultured Tenacibaculum sp.]|uniref:DUF3667 domain-containing protein n=1 Tax=uncultured Tenacibaculum sp. TaxID=174713 RepID=UPI00260FC460|nr:DUF3667 domain-containing protein [uncultured Tenacibaculum sp.]